jgi:hypothetical protein
MLVTSSYGLGCQAFFTYISIVCLPQCQWVVDGRIDCCYLGNCIIAWRNNDNKMVFELFFVKKGILQLLVSVINNL